MARARHVVGIDLGTTNCAVASVDTSRGHAVEVFAVPQLAGEARLATQPTLPSFLYLAGEHDIAPGALAVPWDDARRFAVGTFARVQGTRVPGRLVSSAKSWLCHGGVDREAAILPWGAPPEVEKISPVEASARYLGHIRDAWNYTHPDAPLEAQDIVLTVPASFDEVARELTVAAAQAAGLPRVWLLEEPQAACYAWLSANESDWRQRLAQVKRLLVIDIGGGTSDFSLIAVREGPHGLALERVAVGDHLLLGGDNIDIALARSLEVQLGGQLDSQRWHALTNLCRSAKEELLSDAAPLEVPIRLVGRGRAVVGGVLAATLTRADVERTVIEGFFPLVDVDAMPRRGARLGLQEWGLPFASEPEVSRHLAAFLHRHRDDHGAAEATTASRPDGILFNGGALKPALIRNRLADLVAQWYAAGGAWQPLTLQSSDLDLAVARGAAYYGLVRRGLGVRIGGGAARSYYLGLGDPPGASAPAHVRALCLVHRGMEEGTEVDIAEPALEVLANRGVSFPLYASNTRTGERAGQLVTAVRESLSELPPIRTVLRFGKKLDARKIPVHVQARLTETGTLEVWCRSLSTEHRWRLQFQLRDQAFAADIESAAARQAAEAVLAAGQLQAAIEALRMVFPPGDEPGDGDPVSLMRSLEERLGAGKDAWPLGAIRTLWDVLWEGRLRRARSPQHESRWLNLCGFLLRPGFGAELDDWRIQQLWKLQTAGPHFAKAAQCRAEWWNMWKRVAGGLTRVQQGQLHTAVAPWLLPRLRSRTKGQPKAGPQEVREYWQLMASCERLSAEMKAELGKALLPLVLKGKATDVELWALGRLGARAPVYGPLNCVVARKVVAEWVEALLSTTWNRPEATVFALVQLARCVGDRERDLDGALRQRTAERIRPLPTGRRAARLVTELVPLEAQEHARILDESLPAGLRIRSASSPP
ncbi:MAG: Hsp70 family protein [Candidatus Binatia bacterium]